MRCNAAGARRHRVSLAQTGNIYKDNNHVSYLASQHPWSKPPTLVGTPLVAIKRAGRSGECTHIGTAVTGVQENSTLFREQNKARNILSLSPARPPSPQPHPLPILSLYFPPSAPAKSLSIFDRFCGWARQGRLEVLGDKPVAET